MIRTDCLDPARLAEHARSDLAPTEGAALDRHLVGCRDCLNRFLELGRQSFVPDVPDCHVVKELGRGRFGVVYKAWWMRDEPRIVALKVLSCPGEMEKNRFEREIAVLKKIDSPWVVKCIESGVAGDMSYYIMDFVEGIHLDEYLASSASELGEKLGVFQRVCRAVADAHKKGVVHRDLKPRNILIDQEGQPHILDFGICAIETADWSSWARCTITRAGDIVGTLKYMSPEQAWGGVSHMIDERSDIWTLGVMLYEIVTDGDYPYPVGPTADKPAHEALLDRIRRELPRLPRLDSIPRGRDLEVLLERCLAWEPERRIESAAHLADDLERYCSGRRIKTKRLGVPYRLKRLAVGAATRSRWTFSAAFIAMLGLTLWITTFLFNVGWHVSGHDYQGQQAPSASLIGPGGDAREDILIVGVFDDTGDAVLDFASRAQIEGVTDSVPTWRAVHGYLMERLAMSSPAAVVWDYYFRTPRSGDARLVAGIRRLEEGGVPVVLASLAYREDGTPDLSPGVAGPLAERLRHGAIVARDMVQRPGEFVMVLRRGAHSLVPGLALATLAAVLHPETRLDLDWREKDRWINLLYEIRPGAYLRERDRIELTRIFKKGHLEFAVRKDDQLGWKTFELHRPDRWEQQTVPYQKLLSCSDDELRALVKNRLIVIGDFRTRRLGFVPDRHPVRYGKAVIKDVPGCYLLADAIAGLLDRRYLKSAFPPLPGTFLLMLLVGGVGCLLPIKVGAASKLLERPGQRRMLWVALVSLSVSCLLVMVLTTSYAAVHLGMAGFSLLVPMAGSVWVEFARNRHRVLDRNRRAVEQFGLGTDGTITLAARQL